MKQGEADPRGNRIRSEMLPVSSTVRYPGGFMNEETRRFVDRLTSGTHHALGNFLNSLSTRLQLIEDENGNGHAQKPDSLNGMQDKLTEIQSLTRRLSRFRFPDPDRVSLEEVEASTPGLFLNGSNGDFGEEVRVNVSGADLSGTLNCSREVFREATLEVIRNGIESSGEGEPVRVWGEKNGRSFLVRVKDRGDGLSAEQHERIFEPFYTTKTGHHGLGLSLTRFLLNSVGGEVEVKEVPEGKGTLFVLRFPLA